MEYTVLLCMVRASNGAEQAEQNCNFWPDGALAEFIKILKQHF